MKLDQVFQTARDDDFTRSIAQLAQLTVADVQIISKQPGSTVYYFYLTETLVNKSNPDQSANAQMIRLYNWYISDNPIPQQYGLPPIISFQLVAFDGQSEEPILLLLGTDSTEVEPIVPSQPSVATDQRFIVRNTAASSKHTTTSLLLILLALLVILLW